MFIGLEVFSGILFTAVWRRVGINGTAQTEWILQSRCSTSLCLALVFAITITEFTTGMKIFQ